MATTCRICKSPFTESNPKCHHHNHVSGDYLFAACQDCNLKLKPSLSPRLRRGLPVHNLASYDSAFTLKNFNKKYVERVHKNGTTSFDDVMAILINSENNMQFQIKNVVFADSFQFLSASLDTLVATLRKSGKENFVETTK